MGLRIQTPTDALLSDIKKFSLLFFVNKDISVTVQVIGLKFSVLKTLSFHCREPCLRILIED